MKARLPEPEGFPTFWDIWRKHMRHTDARGLARETFRKHILAGAEPQDIIDGATGFFRFMPEKDRPYVPLSSTWLNRESYIDWAEKERDYQRRLQERESNVVQMPERRPAETAFMKIWNARQEAAE